MKRPEIWTAVAFVVCGFGLAIWLAFDRPPPTPVPPASPNVTLRFDPPPFRDWQSWGAESHPDLDAALGVDGLACGPTISSEPVAKDMIRVRVVAPCRVGQSVDFRFGPIRFDGVIGDKGVFWVSVPALPDQQDVVVGFPDGTQLSLTLPEQNTPLVLGVSWQGEAVVGLSVYEYGRLISSRRPGRGKILEFGTNGGQQATFYALPGDRPEGSIDIAVNIDGLCGSDLDLTVFEALAGRRTERAVRVMAPECPEEGPFTLDNLIGDLRGDGGAG